MAAGWELRSEWRPKRRIIPSPGKRRRSRSVGTGHHGSNHELRNHELTLMDTNQKNNGLVEQADLRAPQTDKLIFKHEVFAIVGAAMEVLNGIGHGYHEKPYENALIVEFALRGISLQTTAVLSPAVQRSRCGSFCSRLNRVRCSGRGYKG